MATRGKVTLTFDGTRLGHLEVVAPLLDRFGFLGTFFADPAHLLQSARDWQEVALRGHEIGNGCLVDAALADGALPSWTLDAVAGEIAETEDLLADLFPDVPGRSFGYPIGIPACADGDYRTVVRDRYAVARAGIDGLNPPDADPTYLRALFPESWTGSEMIEMARKGLAKGDWVVFAFDGVGEGRRAVDLAAVRELLEWLQSGEVPVTPLWSGVSTLAALSAED